jgi:ATP-binding cassette subfamily B protein
LGGIRDVLINGSQQFYCEYYRNADLSLRQHQETMYLSVEVHVM